MQANLAWCNTSTLQNASQVKVWTAKFPHEFVNLYIAWKDQSNAVCRIVHIVLISCITVPYESYSTVTQLIGQIQYSYALNWENTAHSGNWKRRIRSDVDTDIFKKHFYIYIRAGTNIEIYLQTFANKMFEHLKLWC